MYTLSSLFPTVFSFRWDQLFLFFLFIYFCNVKHRDVMGSLLCYSSSLISHALTSRLYQIYFGLPLPWLTFTTILIINNTPSLSCTFYPNFRQNARKTVFLYSFITLSYTTCTALIFSLLLLSLLFHDSSLTSNILMYTSLLIQQQFYKKKSL